MLGNNAKYADYADYREYAECAEYAEYAKFADWLKQSTPGYVVRLTVILLIFRTDEI